MDQKSRLARLSVFLHENFFIGYRATTMSGSVAAEISMDAAVCAYLDETFWVQPKVQHWPAALALPYFLQDAFEIRQMTLMDRQILLAVWKRPGKPSLAAVRGYVEGLAPHTRLAGLSSLARSSMLGDPKWPVHAIGPVQWKAATRAGIEVLPQPLEGAVQWELWWCEPALIVDTGLVDPLSLMLSLQDNADDRVQLALDELKERFPW